jgi:hypothetical protein
MTKASTCRCSHLRQASGPQALKTQVQTHGRRYNVSVDYDNGQHQLYTGRVGPDGVATGVTSNGITRESGKAFTQRLVCLPEA